MAVDGDGNVSVAWEERNAFSGNYDIRVRGRDPAGAWADIETVAGSSADERRPALAAATDGTVYLAWQENAAGQVTVRVARRPLSGTWTADYQSVPGSGWDHGSPGLAADGHWCAGT